MANKPADAEHPFGHGRIEYITAYDCFFYGYACWFNLLKLHLKDN